MDFEDFKPTAEAKKTETGKTAYRFLEKTGFLKLRESDQAFNDWMRSVTFEKFSEFLTRLNGILRKQPIKGRSMDGTNVEITFGIEDDVSYLPPKAEQKAGLLKETFEAVKRIPDNEDRALLMYYALQAIHPFSDGNGRTGRLLHEILTDTGKGLTQEGLSELLDHEGEGSAGTGKGRDIFTGKALEPSKAYYYFNHEAAQKMLGSDFSKEHGGIYVNIASGSAFLPEAAEKSLTSQEAAQAKKILAEGDVPNLSFRAIVLAKFLEGRPDKGKYLYELKQRIEPNRHTVPDDLGKKILGIDAEELIPNLTADDARQLIAIHQQVKAEFIRAMIETFADPDKHETKDSDGKSLPLKDLIKPKAATK